MAKSKIADNIKNGEQMELSYIADGNANQHNYFGKQSYSFL